MKKLNQLYPSDPSIGLNLRAAVSTRNVFQQFSIVEQWININPLVTNPIQSNQCWLQREVASNLTAVGTLTSQSTSWTIQIVQNSGVYVAYGRWTLVHVGPQRS